ncbi:hypothetical protein HYN51_08850 [Limnobaculum parvum]|uniref:Uncharacterized protein n=1 Tax=Limnobaculum parvum TaxID=2172103 RepID=A0A2Y9TY58_9GAMM|nr:hypothetical protein HYN51_08850 [Limnobaculum parvum]
MGKNQKYELDRITTAGFTYFMVKNWLMGIFQSLLIGDRVFINNINNFVNVIPSRQYRFS